LSLPINRALVRAQALPGCSNGFSYASLAAKTPTQYKIFMTILENSFFKEAGSEIVLMIDSNESIGDKPGGLTTILGRLELMDLAFRVACMAVIE
jgi:hypothetical protein